MFLCGKVYVYDFMINKIKGEKELIYWCDVGIIELYWLVYMDLFDKDLEFLLYNCSWLLYIYYFFLLFVMFVDVKDKKVKIIDSLIFGGSYI